jgi:uncharacterized RDD family membrane protein YckC
MVRNSYPGLAVRGAAFAIDLALLAAAEVLLLFLPAAFFFTKALFHETAATLAALPLFAILLLGGSVFLHMAYFTLFHALAGQTIGKAILGLRVVSLDSTVLSPGASFLRWTGYVISSIPLAAGFLWAAVDRDGCAWHDRLARTRVVSIEMT